MKQSRETSTRLDCFIADASRNDKNKKVAYFPENAYNARMIKVLGHRGMRHHRELGENTILAFQAALMHADGIETDVVCSADNIPYLLHDSSIRYIPHIRSWATYDLSKKLDKTSAKRVDKWHFDRLYSWQIDELRLKGGERIPKLSDLFEIAASLPRAREKIFNLELKTPGMAEAVIKTIKHAEWQGQIDSTQVIVTSLDHDEAAAAQRLDPALRTGLIFWQDSVKSCRLYPWDKASTAVTKPISIKNLEDPSIRRMMPDHFVLPAHGLTKIYADAVTKALYPEASFMVWTAGKEPLPEKNRALRRILDDAAIYPHVSVVITNHPLRMKNFLLGL